MTFLKLIVLPSRQCIIILFYFFVFIERVAIEEFGYYLEPIFIFSFSPSVVTSVSFNSVQSIESTAQVPYVLYNTAIFFV